MENGSYTRALPPESDITLLVGLPRTLCLRPGVGRGNNCRFDSVLFRSKVPSFLCVLSFYMAHGRRGKCDGVGECGRSSALQVQLVSPRP